MTTCHGVSTTWCGVYLIFVIAPFARWVNTSTQTHNFRVPSTTMCLCRFCVCRFSYLHMNLFIWSKVLSISWSRFFPMMDFMFSSRFQLRIVNSAFQTCTFYGVVGLSSLNLTWLPLVWNLDSLPLWACHFNVVFRYCAFLLNSLKFDGMNHVLSKLVP
jgi:hypothetical protein